MRVLSKAAPATRAYLRYSSTEATAQRVNQAVNSVKSQGLTKTLCNLYQTVSRPLPASIKTPVSKVVGSLEPLVYYSEVLYHLGKQVVVRQSFKLPTKVDFSQAEAQFFKALEETKMGNLKKLKEIPAEKWKQGALKTFELSALFVVGEIVGRGNLIGYKD